MSKLKHIMQRPTCWIRTRAFKSQLWNIHISLSSPLSPSKKKNPWKPNFDIKMSWWARRTIFGFPTLLNSMCYQTLMHPPVLQNPWGVMEGCHQLSYSNSWFSGFPHLLTNPFLRYLNVICPATAWVLLMQPGERWEKLFSHSTPW